MATAKATESRCRPRLGISACLLGQKVRYNGDDKRHDWLVDRLGQYVQYVPLCPELEMGLGVPRETIRWEREAKYQAPRLRVQKSSEDLTIRAAQTAALMLKKLQAAPPLDGFVLKKDSPSCGLERVKIYHKGIPTREGVGFFAQALLDAGLDIPLIEEGRLTDPEQRGRFVTTVFALCRLRTQVTSLAEFQAFHRDYKLILMAQDPAAYSKLGALVARTTRAELKTALRNYRRGFCSLMARPTTIKKRVNVLQHMLGYFKAQLTASEKVFFLELVASYRRGEVAFEVPLELLRFLVHRYAQVDPKGIGYLASQAIFQSQDQKALGSGMLA